jgi:signal-transduction protein with cAMP-binding, CBS, and nucleotidyltransferase domain
MKLAQVKTGEVIFQLGDRSNAFYIVLKGAVTVLVTKKRLVEEFIQTPILQKSPSTDQLKETVLKAGAAFGELGLLRGIPRTATVVCRDDAVLAVLSKEDFDHIVSSSEESRLAQVVDFLKKVPIFQAMTKAALYKLSYSFSSRTCRLDECIFKEMSVPSFVYIIAEGDFKLVKSAPEQAKPASIRHLYGPRQQSSLKEPIKKTVKLKKAKSAKKLQFAVKSVGEILGDLEVMEGSVYDTSCMCMSRRGVLLAVAVDVSAP